MSLPKAIQQQVEAADAFVAQMIGQPPNGDPDPNANPQDPSNLSADPAPQPIVSPEPQPQPAVPEETWQAKFFTLKGKYDAEVPRLHAQVKELNTQVQQLIAEAAAKPQTAPTPDSVKSLITEQDREAFGTDLLDLIDRATETKIAGFRDQESRLLAEIAELKGKLGRVDEMAGSSSKEMFLDRLSKQVPDWEAMNVDQGFLAWLAEVDPVYGIPRQIALNNAYEALDANRTATIFKQFKATLAPQQTQQPKPSLQSQVAPTRSRTSPAPATSAANTRIFTQNDIARFYDEWRRGLIDEADAVRIEQEIAAASVEGRIR
jgi:hypothetical protein